MGNIERSKTAKVDGIIFDVDGTIWDSTPIVEKAWNHALEEAGHKERVTAKRLQGLFGLPMDAIIRDILPDATEEERERFAPYCYRYEHEYLQENGGIVYEGFGRMLEELDKKYPLYVVSNCQAGYIELMMDKTGFGRYFKDHLCFGDNDKLKAENIRIVCERNGLKNPVYVGDTQMDADACREAGVPIVFASYGFGTVKEPDYVIDSPMELVTLFE